jgi:hypothetical protein
MPLVLMQRAWRDDPKYKDTEFSVYHYPRQYFDQIRGGEKFVYYRPSRDAKAVEASAYFGCGELGDWWSDPQDARRATRSVRSPSYRMAPGIDRREGRSIFSRSRACKSEREPIIRIRSNS